jgi:hypothetical protein
MTTKFFNWVRARFFPATPQTLPEAPKPTISVSPEPAAPPRPQSAVGILQSEPNLTAAELAERAGVTLSYARSLIRRQSLSAASAARRKAPATTPTRVDCTRTRVLDRYAKGINAAAIAEELNIPLGEAEFILKVAKIKKNVKN